MKILLEPCHSVLERDEYLLWTEMGHEVFSFGSYIHPHHPHDEKRPPIMEGKYNEQMVSIAAAHRPGDLIKEQVDWADVIIIHHIPNWITDNWDVISKKPVVWRSIGQSTTRVEEMLKPFRLLGLKVVRYSPREERIPGFIGSDAMIRFYKGPAEFQGWTGEDPDVISFVQDFKNRGEHCAYDLYCKVTRKFNSFLYGPSNQGSEKDGISIGGTLSYEDMKRVLRRGSVFFYTGTQPASYTLAFMEAMMTGIPIVSIESFQPNIYSVNTFEIPDIITNGLDGFYSDDPGELKDAIRILLSDKKLAMDMSRCARKVAIDLFGKKQIRAEWETFFSTLT